MTTCYSDPVFDFDLNFLRPTPNSTVTNSTTDKKPKSILMVKKKIIATDALIKKYCTQKEALDQTEKNLLSAKEECKQICIEHKKSVDTYSTLEKDLQQLRDANKELESKCSHIESQYQAVSSHANQLQTLVKEHQTLIEALKIENKLSKSSDKDYKKMIQPLKKENCLLIRHICLARDIIFGKRKYRLRHKTILKKYDKYVSPDKDILFEEDENNVDYGSDEIPLSPFYEEYDDDAEPSKDGKSPTEKHLSNADLSRIINNTIIESNDGASIDTGRGSSIACSISDKSFQSPDYFINDSPLSDDHELNKMKTKLIDSSTSPIPFSVTVNVCTSPISFDNDLQKNHAMMDRALSPIVLIADVADDITDENDVVLSSSEITDAQESCTNGKETIEVEKKQKEIECLELNNSENISKENSDDCEIEMILSTMRLHNTLITPIPSTPAKASSTSRHCTPNKQNESVGAVCSEAELAREENKKLQASVSELAKEVAYIKHMLMSKSAVTQNNEESTSHESFAENSINEDQIMNQSTPMQLPSQKINTLCANEKTGPNSRTSLDVIMDIANRENLHVIPEVEEHLQETSELQSGDKPASTNEIVDEVDNMSEIIVPSSKTPATIICKDGQSQTRHQKKRLSITKKKITKLEKLKRKGLAKHKMDENIHCMSEVEECFQVSPEFHSEDEPASINETDKVGDNVGKIIVQSSKTSANIMCTDGHSKVRANQNKRLLIRRQKLTKLQKLKRKCLPKYKIKREHVALKEPGVKPKRIPNSEIKKTVTEADSSVTLNDKNVYEKAVKVMSELKRIKRVCTENEIVHPVEKNMLEDNSHNTIDTECSEDNKREESSTTVIQYQFSDSSQIPIASPKSSDNDVNRNEEENTNKNHVVVKNVFSKSPEGNKSLKRGPKNTSPEIPCKRMLRIATLDIFKGKDPKIILQRCEAFTILDDKSTPANVGDTLKNISVTPKDKKSPSKINNASTILSVDTVRTPEFLEVIGTQNINSNRRKSVKDIISQQVSPKAKESQERNARQSLPSNRRKSVRALFSPDATSKVQNYQESHKNQDLLRIQDIFTPEINLKDPEHHEKNGYEKLSVSQRKSVKDMSSPEVSPKVSESQKNSDEGIQVLTRNRRQSIKGYMSSPEVSLKASECQKTNSIQNLPSRRKSVENISSPEVAPKVLLNKKSYSIQGLSSNRRKSVRHISSTTVSPKPLEGHERNKYQGFQDSTSNRRKGVKNTSSTEIDPNNSENQEQYVNPNLMTTERNVSNKRRKIDTCGAEISLMESEHSDINERQSTTNQARESVLCRMIEQYGVKSVKFGVKKIPDSIINYSAKKIEDGIIRIIEVPGNEVKDAMNKFVMDIQKWDINHFVIGLIKYLKDPIRKMELFSKVFIPSAPALTKSEQILLYVISELKKCWNSVDIVDKVLSYIEYTLFSLNRTPEFEIIESMSHFYAVVCRYFKMKTRLRLFVLDAMYCIQYKAIPLIRQCIDVWMHILPLAHMASAQSPLVTCLVYLLHFYKCEDKLNRVQDVRNILSRKYFYKVTEWNETRILELCKNSIAALKDIPAETKMLRLALIILSKRHGPRWCHNNIVKNVLQPIIEKQNNPEHIKAFCVSMFGPLLKPYPADMKVHCEIVMNQLVTILQDNPTPKMAEAVVTSLLYMNKHNQFRVIQALVAWKQKNVSPELELMLKDFVKSKSLKIWKSTLSKAVQ